MKRAVAAVVALMLFAGAAAAMAQAKPNFTGKWTLVPDPNAPAPTGRGRGMGGLGQVFSAEQNDKTLNVATTNEQIGEMKAVYNLDGSESKNPISFNGQSVDRVSKAKWDGAKLVITTTINFNGNAVESTQAWSLDATGNLIVETTSSFTGTPTTTKATYKKG
ncbi:MAG TPA: hypothetical protein VMS54_10705 [Vicinamibacterales bacterium]|nr:hypothetical protein [Vicinamibacterales bacterium]